MGVQQANFSSMSDFKAFSSQTTLGMVLDDPCHLKQVSSKLTHLFQKLVAAAMSYEYSPRTTFITSMNEPTLKGLAKYSRYFCKLDQYVVSTWMQQLIWKKNRYVHKSHKTFLSLLTGWLPELQSYTCSESKAAQEQDYCDQTVDKAMADAHGAAGVISIGKQLIANRTELISVILLRVQNALPEAIHRIHFSYALIVFNIMIALFHINWAWTYSKWSVQTNIYTHTHTHKQLMWD